MSVEVGQVFNTNGGTDCVIIKYNGTYDVTVRFLDENEYITKAAMKEIRNGQVKNPYAKSVFGVGYLGEGLFITSKNKNRTLEYRYWCGMMMRCYCSRYKAANPSYNDCYVCKEWHNFQVFAEWLVKNKYYKMMYELDKDLLVKGNKIYSPETCCLIPKEVNMAINGNYVNKGKHPQGVVLHKHSGKFQAQIGYFGKNKYLGLFKNESEAESVYNTEKQCYVKVVANKWRNEIDDRAYRALMLWSVRL